MSGLYGVDIMDHWRRPRNFGRPVKYDSRAIRYSPVCGDVIEVFVTVGDDRRMLVHFTGTGCGLCLASASMMTEYVSGLTPEEAVKLAQRLIVAARSEPDEELVAAIGILHVLIDHSNRTECVTLSWKALRDAVNALFSQ